MSAFFILGSERSGSNLLRKLIGNHSQICAPISPHFLDAFRTIVPYYGNVAKRMPVLLSDMIELANHRYNRWNLKSGSDSIYKEYMPKTFMEAFHALYTTKAQEDGKIFFLSKDNHVFNHFDIITGFYGQNAKFIYLHRDLRDHTVSWLKTPLFLKTPKEIGEKWQKEQKLCIQFQYQNPKQVLKVKYEDILSNTRGIMEQVIAFMGLNWEDSCSQINANNAPEAQRNIFWKNLDKPIIKNNYNKYKAHLSHRSIKLLESIAKNELTELGYTLTSDGNFNRNRWLGEIEDFLIKRRTDKLASNIINNDMKELKDKLRLIQSISERIKTTYPYFY